jgi:hypothetical protein
MTKPLPYQLDLPAETADSFFVRQKDDYSCGPACLTSVARIFGTPDKTYDMFRNVLNPNTTVGSCNFKMAEVSAEHLPFLQSGEDVYHNGIAVANIMQEEEGHYVIFLCHDGDKIVYYDPYHHQLVVDKLQNLEWISESKHLTRWSINYAPIENNSIDYWLAFAGPQD